MDTAGQEEYSVMREQYVREGNGFLIVFAIDDRISFDEAHALHRWLKMLKDNDGGEAVHAVSVTTAHLEISV